MMTWRYTSSWRSFWLFSAASKKGFFPILPPRKELSIEWSRSFPCMLLRETGSGCDSDASESVSRAKNPEGPMVLKPCERNSFSIAHRVWAFVFLLVSSIPVCGQVRAWEGVLKLPTYEEGAPDPNPPFDQFST